MGVIVVCVDEGLWVWVYEGFCEGIVWVGNYVWVGLLVVFNK